MPRLRSSSATDSSCSWQEDEAQEELEEDEEEQADGDEDGGDVVVDEAAPLVGVVEFTVDTTAEVENDEYIGLPTMVALLISRDLPSFARCLLLSSWFTNSTNCSSSPFCLFALSTLDFPCDLTT